MNEILFFIGGLAAGAVLVYVIMARQQKSIHKLADEISLRQQEEKVRDLERMINQMKDSFGALSMEALSKNTDEFLKLADKSFGDQSKINNQRLDGKKEMIDQTFKNMKGELDKVQEMVQKIETERKQSFGQLSVHLKNSVEQTRLLQETTNQLNTVLSSSQARGQWGERMAEDVLRVAGFIEGINYLKQATGQTTSTRPDFTFLLPNNLKVNMDVKFPFDNYMAFLQAKSEAEQANYKNQFLKDVRNRIKEVQGRDYINPAENTVDYVIVFIPNEQIYAFINETDVSILDEALKNKVILSSPITLYAILASIRQAVSNFNLEKTASQIMALLGDFYKQWENFKTAMEKMGNRIEDAQKEFLALTSTRSKALERPLMKIENLRNSEGLQLAKEEPEQSDD